MKAENETKGKILYNAKQEFMEKGYMHASLRNICKNAGVTTGALYFFFKDKEDLFASLVEELLNRLYYIMNQHYQCELHQVNDCVTEKEESLGAFLDDYLDDLETAKQIIHYMYQYYDMFQLLLTKAQGSRFENCVEQFVEITEKHYRMLADEITIKLKKDRIDDYMIHWISHMSIDLFIHMLTHENSEEAAMKHMELIIKYLLAGWTAMFK